MPAMGRIADFFSGHKTLPTTPPPYLLKLRSSKEFILGTICLAIFTDIFLYGIIVPVIPFAIHNRAGVPESSVQSYVSILLAVYGGALLVSSPLAGWYADQSSSRRAPLLFGLFALVGSTLMLCLARNVALMIVGRILQGFSAAIVWTVGQALLVDTVGQDKIGQSLGWVGLSMSMGVLLAPLIGGVVYERSGYYSVYYIGFALLLVDIFLRLFLIEKKIARQWDVEEEVTQITESEGTPVSSDEHQNLDEKTAEVVPQKHNTVPAITSEFKRASKYPPVITLLKSRRLLVALWGCTVQGALMTAFDSVIPLFVQETFHWNSTGAGLTFLALIVPNFASPAIGWASDKYGPRYFCFVGFIIAIPFWVLLRLVTHDSLNQKVLLCALLALIGLALTLVMPPLMAEITYVVEAKEKSNPGRYGSNGAYAQAYGLFVTAFAAGTMIGPVWAGYVRDSAGWATMAWSLGLFSFAAAIPCLIWTGGLITQKQNWSERGIKAENSAATTVPAVKSDDVV